MPDDTTLTAGLCLHCQKKPGKPKFCSKSCAASFNNRRTPKRRPEGKCADCGANIPSKQRLFTACSAKEAQAQRRTVENVQTFRTPTGEVRERPVQQAWVHGSMVFEPHANGGRQFTLADSCGDFLDALLGFVFARPAYIRPDDIHRYAAWVDSFRAHVIERSYDRGPTARPQAVATLPLGRLDYALGDWVDTVLQADNYALFPTWAVDAARFIEAHAHGYSDYGPESWRITGLVASDPADSWSGRSRLAEPRLKHEITSRLKGSVTVPQWEV